MPAKPEETAPKPTSAGKPVSASKPVSTTKPTSANTQSTQTGLPSRPSAAGTGATNRVNKAAPGANKNNAAASGANNNNTPTTATKPVQSTVDPNWHLERFTMYKFDAKSKPHEHDSDSEEFRFVSTKHFVLSIPGRLKTS
jgi:hypothetical protein